MLFETYIYVTGILLFLLSYSPKRNVLLLVAVNGLIGLVYSVLAGPASLTDIFQAVSFGLITIAAAGASLRVEA